MCMSSHIPALQPGARLEAAGYAPAACEPPAAYDDDDDFFLGIDDSPTSAGKHRGAADQFTRLGQIHLLGEAAAEAYLQGLAMPAAEQHSVLGLWPDLLRLTAAAPSAAASLSPFAAAAHVVLAERGGGDGGCSTRSAFDLSGGGSSSASGGGATPQPLALTFPQPSRADCAAALCFSLSAAPATSGALAATAEMEVFAAQVNRCIAQSSKEALEDALSELRHRLPSASAVSLVRSSIEGTLIAGDLLHSSLQTSLRTKMLRRSQSVSLSGEGSESATPLRISLSMSLPPL